jgi:hypothetical protein
MMVKCKHRSWRPASSAADSREVGRLKTEVHRRLKHCCHADAPRVNPPGHDNAIAVPLSALKIMGSGHKINICTSPVLGIGNVFYLLEIMMAVMMLR